ncbi:MAG TPA: CoA-transferase [Acidimicrobiales bacterium]|nr:CoA-transferase [Acidimicrobiales bacterium]
MSDKRASLDEAVAEVRSGMTVGIGGWGSRRKPLAVVRALCRADVTDLTLVTYGGPDVGLLCAAGKLSRVVCGFVTLTSVPLDPHWRAARQSGAVALTELDEGLFYAGLQAAAWRLPFLPSRAGLGADLLARNPALETVVNPYTDGPFADPNDAGATFVAAPALRLDVAFVHANVADSAGNAAFLGPDRFFDELYLGAARRRVVTAERVVHPGPVTEVVAVKEVTVHRLMTDLVVEAPGGAHFSACDPDYPRDEAFLAAYVAAAADPESFAAWRATYLDVSEADYQAAVGRGGR